MGKKRSEIWNHFTRDEEKLRAHCRYCDQSVSILGGNISNLTRHLKKKHSKISLTRLLSGEVVSFNDSEEQESIMPVSSELAVINEKNPTDYVVHVQAIDLPAEVSTSNPATEVLALQQTPTRKNKSSVWDHFTKYQSPDARRRIGKCHYCPKIVSWCGGVSNLKRHLTQKHSDIVGGMPRLKSHTTGTFEVESHEGAAAESQENNPLAMSNLMPVDVPQELEVPSTITVNELPKPGTSLRRSRVWSHFTSNESNSKAKCNYCGTEISMYYGSLGNLFRHLRKKHPKVRIPKRPPVASRRLVVKMSRSELVPVSSELDETGSARVTVKPAGKGKRVSHVWKYFTKLRNADNTRIRGECHYCKRLVSASSGSVSNLKRHLRKKHAKDLSPKDLSSLCGPEPLPKNYESRLPFISSRPSVRRNEEFEVSLCDNFLAQSSSSTNPVILKLSAPTDMRTPFSADKKKFADKHLVRFICKGFHDPFSFFEGTVFKELLQALNAGYELTSLEDFKNSLLPKMFEETVAEVQAKLNTASAVCLSAETWITSKEKRFCTLKAHFLVNEEPHCSTLSCSEFIDSYVPDNVAIWFQSTVIEWNLENKIAGIVTDDSLEMTVAAEFCNWHRVPCFAYMLNGIIFKGLKEVDSIIDKVRIASTHIRACPQLTNFYEIQRQVGLPKSKLKEDNPAVWATTCKMLERFLANKDCVVPTLTQSNYNEEEVRNLDSTWEIIDGIARILNFFSEVVSDLSVEQSVVLSRVPILLRIITDRLDSLAGLPNEIEVMRTVILAEFNAKFNLAEMEKDPLVGFAVLLDPRFKKEGFSSEEHFTYVKNAVINELGSSMLALPASKSQDGSMLPTSQSSSLWAEFDKLVKQAVDGSSQSPGYVTELENYLAESLLPRTSNPLIWWENRKVVYPALYALMLKRLCTPASSVPFKLLFTKEGSLLTDRRFLLNSSKLVPMITFLHQNL